jgi:hypothetical protein
MKETAVEWLFELWCKNRGALIPEDFEQAKEMEKQQKATYWQEGYDSCEFHNDYDELQKEPINNPYRK